MTLAEARKILEDYHPHTRKVREALRTVIPILPEPEYKPSAKDRMEYYRGMVVKGKGFDPFETRSRDTEVVMWRNCIYYRVRMEEYSYPQIGKSVGYSHTTILSACRHVRDWLDARDIITVRVWNELLNLIGE